MGTACAHKTLIRIRIPIEMKTICPPPLPWMYSIEIARENEREIAYDFHLRVLEAIHANWHFSLEILISFYANDFVIFY